MSAPIRQAQDFQVEITGKANNTFEFGTVTGFHLNDQPLYEPKPIELPKARLSVPLEFKLAKGFSWQKFMKQLDKLRARETRPYRRAYRRALSRNRIEATRDWRRARDGLSDPFKALR